MAARAGRSPTSWNATNLVANTTGWCRRRIGHDVVVTNSYGSATSAVATLTGLRRHRGAAVDIGQQIRYP